MGVAVGGVVDDRVEVDERVVAGGVLVGRRLGLGAVRAADRRVAALVGSRLGSAPMLVVVVPPGEAGGGQLRAIVWTAPGRRTQRPRPGRRRRSTRREVVENVWQSAWLSDVRRLAGDHRDVVVVRFVADPVVLGQVGALRREASSTGRAPGEPPPKVVATHSFSSTITYTWWTAGRSASAVGAAAAAAIRAQRAASARRLIPRSRIRTPCARPCRAPSAVSG